MLVQWVPTRAGFLAFMVESKVVYEEFERILSEAPVASCKYWPCLHLDQQRPVVGVGCRRRVVVTFLFLLSGAYCVVL